MPTPGMSASLPARKARIEIVDEERGAWGHINIDQIAFSDVPVNAAALEELLEELLPESHGESQDRPTHIVLE